MADGHYLSLFVSLAGGARSVADLTLLSALLGLQSPAQVSAYPQPYELYWLRNACPDLADHCGPAAAGPHVHPHRWL
jgi:hypothetical protein